MKMIRKMILVLWLISCVTLVYGQTLHAIFVINTEDEGIGCIHDYNNWIEELKEIEKHTGLKIKRYDYMDNNWSRESVMAACKNLSIGSNDVVLFYYSGHGLRLSTTQDVWPVMALQGHVGLEQNWVQKVILDKNPRLFINIVDACNNILSNYDVITRSPERRDATIRNNYRNLFLKSKGYIIASGCIPGQFSYGGGTGGVFTNQFLMALHDIAGKDDCNWKRVMVEAVQPIYGGDQQPQSKLRIFSDYNGKQYSFNSHEDSLEYTSVTTSTTTTTEYYTDNTDYDYYSDDDYDSYYDDYYDDYQYDDTDYDDYDSYYDENSFDDYLYYDEDYSYDDYYSDDAEYEILYYINQGAGADVGRTNDGYWVWVDNSNGDTYVFEQYKEDNDYYYLMDKATINNGYYYCLAIPKKGGVLYYATEGTWMESYRMRREY